MLRWKCAVALLGLIFGTPLSAFAFLGMNAGATLQGPLPAWTKQLGVPSQNTNAYSLAIDPMGHLYIGGRTSGGLDFNAKTGQYDAFACQYIGN